MRKIELNPLIIRWRKTTRTLNTLEQQRGRHITDMLDQRTDTELALFRDPLEAAMFFCILDISMENSDRNSITSSPARLLNCETHISEETS